MSHPNVYNSGPVHGDDCYAVGRYAEMAAFDSLSPCVRRALAGASFNIAAAYVARELAGLAEAKVVAMIEQSDRVYGGANAITH